VSQIFINTINLTITESIITFNLNESDLNNTLFVVVNPDLITNAQISINLPLINNITTHCVFTIVNTTIDSVITIYSSKKQCMFNTTYLPKYGIHKVNIKSYSKIDFLFINPCFYLNII
jgi:hypothetical protein